MAYNVLVGSPIRQKYRVLESFLKGLQQADMDGLHVSYCFVDDNTDERSSKLLHLFAEKNRTEIKSGKELTLTEEFCMYTSDEETHQWDTASIRKIAYFKDWIIEYALQGQYDYLFFLDSDIVIDRHTLTHLISRKVEIVSSVFWTQWRPNWQLEPQCFWIPALSRRDKSPFSTQQIDIEEARQLQRNYFAQMRIPGIYKVDGLGACTMLARAVLEAGVRFKEIPNLGVLGEDRHFCVRAAAAGFSLFFDTVYPAYHIYREEYLNRVDEFCRDGFKFDMCQSYSNEQLIRGQKQSEYTRIFKKICGYIGRKTWQRVQRAISPPLTYQRKCENQTIARLMVITDENIRYFKDALKQTKAIADYLLIADATTTINKTESFLNDNEIYGSFKAHDIHKMKYSNMRLAYEQLWNNARRYSPDWILCMNANEMLQQDTIDAIKHIVLNISVDRYDFIVCNEQIVDENTKIEEKYAPYMMRFNNRYSFHWNDSIFERFPREGAMIPYAAINLRVHCLRDSYQGIE